MRHARTGKPRQYTILAQFPTSALPKPGLDVVGVRSELRGILRQGAPGEFVFAGSYPRNRGAYSVDRVPAKDLVELFMALRYGDPYLFVTDLRVLCCVQFGTSWQSSLRQCG